MLLTTLFYLPLHRIASPLRPFCLSLQLLACAALLYQPRPVYATDADASAKPAPSDKVQSLPQFGKTSSPQIIVNQRAGQIDIYMKGSNAQSDRWLRYRMQNKPNPSVRSDVWRWHGTWEVQRTAPHRFRPLTRIGTEGEVEMAVRQKGKSDFMGGAIHGDELKTTARLWVDGVERPLNKLGDYTANSVVFEQSSVLLEVDVEEHQELAQSERKWTFKSGEVLLQTQLHWLKSVELIDSYLAMFPLERLHKGKQISAYGAREPLWQTEAIDQHGFQPHYSTAAHVKAWGDSGYCVEVEVLEGWDKPGREFNFSPAKQYNKFYFDFTGKGYRTRPGEVMRATTRFAIDTQN